MIVAILSILLVFTTFKAILLYIHKQTVEEEEEEVIKRQKEIDILWKFKKCKKNQNPKFPTR